MRNHRPRAWVVAGLLALMIAGTGSLAGPVSANSFRFSPFPWLNAALDVANAIGGDAVIDSVVGQHTVGSGTDGRITILLLGSDYRPRLSGTGERMDSIIFMTIDNASHISAISLPRDVGNVPIGPGEVFKAKINGLFKHYKQIYGSRNTALDKVRTAFMYAFNIQIDYVAYVRFTGFERMVKYIGGVHVTVPYDIYDSKIYDTREVVQPGAKFRPATPSRRATMRRCATRSAIRSTGVRRPTARAHSSTCAVATDRATATGSAPSASRASSMRR